MWNDTEPKELTGGALLLHIPDESMTMIYFILGSYKIDRKYKDKHPLAALLASTGASIITPKYHDLKPENPDKVIWKITYPYVGGERWYQYILEVLEMLAENNVRIEGMFGLKDREPWHIKTLDRKIVETVMTAKEAESEEVKHLVKELNDEVAMIYAYDYTISHPQRSPIQSKTI